MKRFLYLFLVLALYACSNESADDDNPDNNISELIGIYEAVWVEEESNTIECPGTIDFKSDNTSEDIWYDNPVDDNGNEICVNEVVTSVVRSYEVTINGSNVIRGDLGIGEEGIISISSDGVDMTHLAAGEDTYAITFEYNKNTQELYYNLYLDADDIIVYMFQKL